MYLQNYRDSKKMSDGQGTGVEKKNKWMEHREILGQWKDFEIPS